MRSNTQQLFWMLIEDKRGIDRERKNVAAHSYLVITYCHSKLLQYLQNSQSRNYSIKFYTRNYQNVNWSQINLDLHMFLCLLWLSGLIFYKSDYFTLFSTVISEYSHISDEWQLSFLCQCNLLLNALSIWKYFSQFDSYYWKNQCSDNVTLTNC